jgi:hypothetical protein
MCPCLLEPHISSPPHPLTPSSTTSRHAASAAELGMRRFAASEEMREAKVEISKTYCALYEKA